MGRYREWLTLFVASAIPTAVLFPTWGAEAQTSDAVSPAITPARIAEIMAFVRQNGRLSRMGPITTAPLGLTQPGIPFMVRQTLVRDGTRRHYWSIHDKLQPVAHVMLVEGRSVDTWVFDMNGNLTHAARIREGVFTLVPLDQMRAEFEAEMRLWAAVNFAAPNQPNGE